MADIKYILELDTKGAESNLARLRGNIRQTNSAFEGLRGLLAGVAAAVSVREIVQLSDTVGNLRNKLITISPTLKDVENQFNAVGAIALQSRAPLEAVGDLYFRIARAGNELGISQKQAADITETLSKAMTTTGLSAAEAAGPLLQIGQALQSGRFQGDELRSVLEGMPVVSQALAQELGVTVGELRKLGSEGKITADVFVRAMQRAKAGVDDAFARSVPTITQSFTQLQTALALSFAEFDKITGGSGSLANVLQSVVDTINEFTRSLKENAAFVKDFVDLIVDIAIALGSLFVLNKISTALATFFTNAAMARKGLLSMISPLLSFSKLIDKTKNGLYLLGALFGNLVNAVRNPVAAFAALTGGLTRLIPIIGAATVAFQLLDFALKQRTGDGIIAWADKAGKAIADLFGITYQTEKEKQELAKQQKAIDDAEIKRIENKFRAQQQYNQSSVVANDLLKNQREQLEKAARAYQDIANQQAKALRDQIEEIGLTEEQIRVKEAQRNAESAYLNEAKRLQDELYRVKQSGDATEKKQIPILLGLLAELDNKYKANLETNTKLSQELNNRLSIEKQLAEFDRMDDALKAQSKSIENTQAQLALETAKLRLSQRERDAIDARYSLEQARLSAIEPLQQRLLELKRSNSESDKELIPIIEEQIAKVNELYGKAVPAQMELLAAKERELEITKLINFAEDMRKSTAEKLRDIQRDTAKLTMTDIEKKYYDIANAAEDSARRAIEAEEKRRGVKLPIEEQREYYREAKKQAEELMQAQAQHEKQARSWSTGWTKAYKNYVDDATNAAKTAESIFTKATKGMEDAIVGFAKTGKFEWKSFVASMLEELLRSQIKQTMASIFSFNGSTAPGSGLGSILGFANGGIIPTNGPVLVGERGPELISGASGRVVTPNNQLGNTTVNYNINAVDALSFKQLVASDPGFIHAVAMKGGMAIPAGR